MIKQDDTYTHETTFTQDQVNAFALISGDANPIHTDPEFAAKTPFGRPIIHGMFSASVFSKVFGTLWPGEGTIYLYQDMKFLAPAFVNEKYTACFKALEVDTAKHRGLIQCRLIDSNGNAVIEGQAKLINKNQFV
ncbi:MAG: MaoC family dehydratase [Bacteroidales bacterium]|nr:MaoC family dehydratase [Bacteroidales bacterium]MCL2738663.1 MaoC family dehydratase [Bacteroidales bacterium]